MWKAHGVGGIGKRFRFQEGTKVLTELRLAWLRQQADFSWGTRGYRCRREGMWSGDFRVESGGDVLATATKPSFFERRYLVDVEGEELELSTRSALLRAFDLRQGRRIIGSIEPLSVLERGAVIALPDELDPPVRVFITWLVLNQWMQSRSVSAN